MGIDVFFVAQGRVLMTIKERVTKLQELMKENNIDIYVVPTDDFHHSECVADYFKSREFITGFTGSAGVAVIQAPSLPMIPKEGKDDECFKGFLTEGKTGLWTDGRYFVQAGLELADTGFTLYKMGEEGVPTLHEYIRGELKSGGTLGFDGRTIGVGEGLKLKKIVEEKGGRIVMDVDLVGAVWEERPALPTASVYLLDDKYTGQSAWEKLTKVREHMEKTTASVFFLTTLDDICWLLNIRGSDIPFVPFVLSYLMITKEEVVLYADKKKFKGEILDDFEKLGISIKGYHEIYKDVKNLSPDEVVLLDPEGVNFTLYSSLPTEVKVVKEQNPVMLMKAVKNQIEIENTRNAHIKDGVVNTKFMYWLKNHPNIATEDELSLARKLESLRKEQDLFIGTSFSPICAYQENGALCHYSASEASYKSLTGEGLLITDTGGHYLDGSTDITRTYVIGKATQEEKRYFTTVAKSMLRLSNLRFLYGCTGQNLDIIAREAFWQQGVDYNHGTGHGVGHVGGIHEPPITIHWKKRAHEPVAFEEYMVTSNEPGFYQEGKFGIRLENELVVRKGEKTPFGQFMYFETITFAPIDLDGIEPERMTEQEKEWLNHYHKEVVCKIGPYLTEEERDWLKEATREI